MPNDPTTTTTDTSHGDQTSSTSAHGATSTSHGDRSSTNTPSIEDLQRQLAALQSQNAEFLADNQKYRKKQKEQEEAAQAAEQARLAEAGQFKELAAKHETRVKELEPISASYSKLAEQIQAQIEAEIKDWPQEVKALVPGADVPVEQRLEQMTRLRPLLEKLQVQAKGQNPGNRPNPQPANQQTNRQQAMEANRAAFVQKRSYGF
jgi:chromosome segregation ATPase